MPSMQTLAVSNRTNASFGHKDVSVLEPRQDECAFGVDDDRFAVRCRCHHLGLGPDCEDHAVCVVVKRLSCWQRIINAVDDGVDNDC